MPTDLKSMKSGGVVWNACHSCVQICLHAGEGGSSVTKLESYGWVEFVAQIFTSLVFDLDWGGRSSDKELCGRHLPPGETTIQSLQFYFCNNLHPELHIKWTMGAGESIC